ncbi:MAG: type I-D CRISPR-associated helicase Cas3', partial [Synechococcaceae cyanobacterium SM2_3_1]|nr:type I-D CRISPR-associated helicase Cas3' [Synechococcaceae cyanobacterium SM2_3_1]
MESLSKAAFLRELHQTAVQTGQAIAQGGFEYCLAFLRVRAYRTQPLRWRFVYAGSLAAVAATWRVQVLVGVGIWQPDNPWIREMDRRLRQQALVSYVVPMPVAEVR